MAVGKVKKSYPAYEGVYINSKEGREAAAKQGFYGALEASEQAGVTTLTRAEIEELATTAFESSAKKILYNCLLKVTNKDDAMNFMDSGVDTKVYMMFYSDKLFGARGSKYKPALVEAHKMILDYIENEYEPETRAFLFKSSDNQDAVNFCIKYVKDTAKRNFENPNFLKVIQSL